MSATGTENEIGSRKPMRSRTFWLLAAVFLVFAFLFLSIQSARTPHPGIVVSEQTTRISGPLDTHGNVDYLAALNQMASEGVTPQNNAAVLLLQAESGLKPADRDRYLQLLGVKPPADETESLSDFLAFVRKKRGRVLTGKELDDLEGAIHKPWKRIDLPLAAEWMASSDKSLDLVVEGSRRPKCYFPLVKAEGADLNSVLLDHVQNTRTAARVLVARAMQRIGEGNLAGARQDLLAGHRMGRLVGSTPFIIAGLVGMAIDSIAFEGDIRLMESGRLSAADALVYQKELRNLPPLPDMTRQLDTSERFAFLDTVCQLSRGKAIDAVDLPREAKTQASAPILRFLTNSALVNWNTVLAIGNEQYDKVVLAARQPTHEKRQEAFEELDREYRAMRSEIRDYEDAATGALGDLARGHGLSLRMAHFLLAWLSPAFAFRSAEDRAQTRSDLEQIGFALAAYQADHHAYPDRVEALIPKYISHLPEDPFSQKPFLYKRQGTGFLLYSVGDNGVDDGGKTSDTYPRGDDIAIQIPVPESREP